MSTLKECTVVMLPTEGEAHIFQHYNNIYFAKDPFVPETSAINQHLYILSDDKIKEGDWCYDTHPKANKENLISQWQNDYENHPSLVKYLKKIIATTNKSLMLDNSHFSYRTKTIEKHKETLPKPSKEFIEKYCKLDGIDNILVEYEHYDDGMSTLDIDDNYPYEYPIRLKISKDNTITIKPVKDSWNREEVEELLNKYFLSNVIEQQVSTEEWIKENL